MQGRRRFVAVAGALLPLLAGGVIVPALGAPPTVAQTTYLVGVATRDITPSGLTNLGGFGLGDGTVPDNAVFNRGRQGVPGAEHIAARAVAIDDVVIASIETQGMFAAYKGGPYGLADMAQRVATDRSIRADHVVIAADHTHAGPDTIGAWGFVPDAYMQTVFNETVAAIEAAIDARVASTLRFGASDAPDLIYNQNCLEALNQSPQPNYPGPNWCTDPSQMVKDAKVRVLRAEAVSDGHPVVTLVSYAAHATLGGGPAGTITGDWPQYLSDALTATGTDGTGIAMEGAVGRTQPCRPQCSFTDPNQPGINLDPSVGTKRRYVDALMAHVRDALAHTTSVAGPVDGGRQFIREEVTGPAVAALFVGGKSIGAELRRSQASPFMVATTIGTPVSALRIGQILVTGFPGEAYPNISLGVAGALNDGEVFPLGLANDQLGYLIAPTESYPEIAATVAVNDNAVFNVSPTIGDHVMCASIGLGASLGFTIVAPPRCALFGAQDMLGDPLASTGIGGPPVP